LTDGGCGSLGICQLPWTSSHMYGEPQPATTNTCPSLLHSVHIFWSTVFITVGNVSS